MGRKYASGSRAYFICGRCGLRGMYVQSVFDGVYPNMRVHTECFEPKHPQEKLTKVTDPVVLWRAQPENGGSPSVLTAELTLPNTVTMSWTEAEMFNARFESYDVYRAVVDDDGTIGDYVLLVSLPIDYDDYMGIESETLSYIDTTLADSLTYTYHVIAKPAGEGDFSQVSNEQQIVSNSPITNPVLTTTLEIADVLATWTPLIGFDADRYDLYRAVHNENPANEVFVLIYSGSALEFLDESPVFGTTYDYRVDAIVSTETFESNEETEVIPSPPATPVLAGSVISDTEIDLSWTNVGAVTGYRLYRSVDGGAYTLLVDQPGVSYHDLAVVVGSSYSYYVFAYDTPSGLQSDNSNIVGFSISALIEVITASRDWTKPSGLLSVEVTVFGGGAGGRGGGGHSSLASYSGHGGGGGGITRQTYLDAALPATVACTIGAGGAGGAGLSSAARGLLGDPGGSTSFGAFLTAGGGDEGVSESGGAGGTGTIENGGRGADGHVNSSGSPDGSPGANTTLSGAGGGCGGIGSGTVVREGGAGGDAGAAVGGARGASTLSSSATADTVGLNGSAGANGADHGAGAGGGGGGGACNSNAGATGNAIGGQGAVGGLYGGGGGGGGQAKKNGSAIKSFGGDGGDGGQGAIILRYTYV